MFDVSGKIGLITGGTQGIGAAIAKEFLQAGLRGIAILARTEGKGLQVVKDLNEEFGDGKAIFIQTDVADKKQFDDAFKRTIEVFKNIDIVVNNAVVDSGRNWEKYIAVNLTGPITGTFLAFENYIPKYRTGQEGVIINISSVAGLYGNAGAPHYAASKAGVIELSRSIGNDIHYNRVKVKVIAICPGYTDTPGVLVTEENYLGAPYFKAYQDRVKDLRPQPSTTVSKAVVDVIKKGRNGSVWIVMDNQPPYEVRLEINKVINM
ncbi:hypothetical protein RI129_004855 [Pyrocoelia pectoralis]|uniref:Uncharacterized protein n=1 Tax=Pyrocoelia pectoralis TaxID=417401 RepID=A0AAN7VJ22_9COLE